MAAIAENFLGNIPQTLFWKIWTQCFGADTDSTVRKNVWLRHWSYPNFFQLHDLVENNDKYGKQATNIEPQVYYKTHVSMLHLCYADSTMAI